MTRKIDIFDTTLRDGEQSPGASMNSEEKLVIARQLLRLGVDGIEAGFPASSPEDFKSVQQVAQLVGDAAVVMALARAVESDIDNASRALEPAAHPRIHVGIGVSDSHLRDKLDITHEECLERIDICVRRATHAVESVQFYAEDAARADLDFLTKACQVAVDAGANVINIPDTTGYSLPQEFAARIVYLLEHVEGLRNRGISVHCHNDLGLATALSLAAVSAGATQVECTINGIGERAGNAAMEEVVMGIALHGATLDARTSINTTEFAKTSRLVSSITGLRVQANKAIVGANAFAHSSGIHQDGVLKSRSTYQIIDPVSVGAQATKLVLTSRSGRAALKERLANLGYEFDADTLGQIYQEFLNLADRKKEVYDEDLESLINERERSQTAIYTLQSLQVSTGFPLTPTVTLTLADEAGREHTVATTGDGPVNAAYDAVNKIVGEDVDLAEYSLQAVTRGTDAIAEVTVRIAQGNKVFVGRGADPDIVVSSVRAYLNALNRLLISQRA